MILMEKPHGIQILPYVQAGEGWNMPESFIRDLYWRVKGERKAPLVFYEEDPGEDGFVSMAQSMPFFVVKRYGVVAGIGWLGNMERRTAEGSFCPLGPGFSPEELGGMIQWLMWPDKDTEPLLDMITGKTASFNRSAMAFVEKVPGYIRVGNIPKGRWCGRLGKSIDITLYAFERMGACH